MTQELPVKKTIPGYTKDSNIPQANTKNLPTKSPAQQVPLTPKTNQKCDDQKPQPTHQNPAKPTANTMHDNFEKYLPNLLKSEGGYVNDKNDSGGPTNKGITLEIFNQCAKSDLGLEPTLENLKQLTDQQAAILYRKHFWNTIKGDEINNASLAYAIYDFHVTSGTNAITILQKTISEMGENLKVDGNFGKNTLDAINKLDAEKLFKKLQENRKKYNAKVIAKNSKDKEFEKGWDARVDSIKYETN